MRTSCLCGLELRLGAKALTCRRSRQDEPRRFGLWTTYRVHLGTLLQNRNVITFTLRSSTPNSWMITFRSAGRCGGGLPCDVIAAPQRPSRSRFRSSFLFACQSQSSWIQRYGQTERSGNVRTPACAAQPALTNGFSQQQGISAGPDPVPVVQTVPHTRL